MPINDTKETSLHQCWYINMSYIPIADQNFRTNTFCALLPKYVRKRFVHKGIHSNSVSKEIITFCDLCIHLVWSDMIIIIWKYKVYHNSHTDKFRKLLFAQ